MNEIFKSIPSTNGRYEASNLGRVRRRPTATNRYPAPLRVISNGKNARAVVEVARQGRIGGTQLRSVAVLVLDAFLPVRPEGAVAAYVDRNPSNVALHNLAWRPRGERISQGIAAKQAEARQEQSRSRVLLASALDGRTYNAVETRLTRGQDPFAIAEHFGLPTDAVYGVKALIDGSINTGMAVRGDTSRSFPKAAWA